MSGRGQKPTWIKTPPAAFFPLTEIAEKSAMYATISGHYRRRAQKERELAAACSDTELKRIHLDQAAECERMATRHEATRP